MERYQKRGGAGDLVLLTGLLRILCISLIASPESVNRITELARGLKIPAPVRITQLQISYS